MYEDSKALCSRRQNCVRVTSVLLQQDCTAQSMTTQTISFMQSPHWHSSTGSGSGGNLLVAKTGVSTVQCRHTPRTL